jgi:hypothetical protein
VNHKSLTMPTSLWVCTLGRDRTVINAGSSGNAGVEEYHPAILLDGAAEALEEVPEGSTVHVISDLTFFTDILNANRSERKARGYLRTNGKELAYRKQWEAIDAITEDRSLTVSAGPPPKDAAPNSPRWVLATRFGHTKDDASKAARNIGIPYKEWDL